MNPSSLKFRDLRRRFDRAAIDFDAADFVHRQTADALFDRLQPIVVDARTVLDLGSATGSACRKLQRRFKKCRIIALDASHSMLRRAHRKKPWFSRTSFVQGNALMLPLKVGSVDMIFSNLLLPWIDDAEILFTDIARVLRADGLFLFSALGPDSLSELRQAWARVDDGPHVNHFPDMHDIGDALVHAGLRDPVLDTDFLNVSYRDTASLLRDLTQVGARNSLSERRKTLTGKGRFGGMLRELDACFADGTLSLRLEIVYGHAWGGGPRQPAGEFRIDPGQIPRRRS